jgi:cytochrome d ubiquinol oxidase subunit I
VLFSAYLTGSFIIVSLASYKLLKRNITQEERDYHSRSLRLGLTVGAIFSLLTAVNGHATAQMLHHYQPEKLAAAEGLFETTAYAPLAVFGVVDPATSQIKGGLEIPWALSFLAGNRFDTVVKGLNEYPEELWPPLYIHTLFNLMVVIGMALIGLSFGALAWKYMLKRALPRWFLRILVWTGALSLIGIETGWIFSCSGRQPWTIYHMQLTKDAATKTGNLGLLFTLFLSIYVVLLLLTAIVLRQYFKHRPVTVDLMPDTPVPEQDGVKTHG